MAVCSRNAAQALIGVGPQRREALLMSLADNLLAAKAQILEANNLDIEQARENKLRSALAARLVLDEKKLKTVVDGSPSLLFCLLLSSWCHLTGMWDEQV